MPLYLAHPVLGLIGLPPQIMLLLTVSCIAYLLQRDLRERPNVTWAVWLPTIWMFLMMSRPVSQWLAIFGFSVSGVDAAALEEGSPIDASVLFAMIVLASYVLNRRQVNISHFARENPWIMAFILYCLVAVVWSDFPFVSLKRWIKILGHPMMVLILFTEPDPAEALRRMMKRTAYVALPLSICWLKYFPKLGRDSSEWGQTGFCGIAANKNLLGCTCLILGLFLAWQWMQIWRLDKTIWRRNELRLIAFLLLMLSYLLIKAHSSTALLSSALGGLVIVVLGFQIIDKRAIGAYAVVVVISAVTAQLTFDVYGKIVDFTGHGATIEGRAELWHTLLGMARHPLFGEGFESFWLGGRLQTLWAQYWWHPTEAHNGYLETFLNLGLVGLILLMGVILSTFRKCWIELLRNFEWGRFRMGVLVAILAYNWTEAAFKALHLAFFAFYIIAVNFKKLRMLPVGCGGSMERYLEEEAVFAAPLVDQNG